MTKEQIDTSKKDSEKKDETAKKEVLKDEKGKPLSEQDIAIFQRYGKGPY